VIRHGKAFQGDPAPAGGPRRGGAAAGPPVTEAWEAPGAYLSKDADAALRILPVASGRPRDRFGGRERAPLQPPLVDILVPAGTTQEQVLQSYDLSDGLPAEQPGVVPGT
jgi:hypothetical protein